MVHLDGVTIGDEAVPGVTADGAIFDSGTSLIATNAQDAAAINAVRSLFFLAPYGQGQVTA